MQREDIMSRPVRVHKHTINKPGNKRTREQNKTTSLVFEDLEATPVDDQPDRKEPQRAARAPNLLHIIVLLWTWRGLF